MKGLRIDMPAEEFNSMQELIARQRKELDDYHDLIERFDGKFHEAMPKIQRKLSAALAVVGAADLVSKLAGRIPLDDDDGLNGTIINLRAALAAFDAVRLGGEERSE